MKILHTSDWHLGRILHEQNLAPDQQHFLDQFLDHCREHPYDAVIIAGDIFDRSIPNEDAIDLWNRFLVRYSDAVSNTPLIVIAGNHDSAARLSTASEIIEKTGIHIRGGSDRICQPVSVTDREGAEADVWCLPFLWAGSFSRDDNGEEKILHSQTEVIEEGLRQIRAAMNTDRINILVSHCFVTGGESSDSERTLVGTASRMDLSQFDGFEYVALGHLHRAQTLSFRVHYSGTPLAYSFSEAGQKKAFLSVNLAKNENPLVEKIPVIPLREMMDLSGTLDDMLFSSDYDVAEDAYVRVCLTAPAGATLPIQRLRHRFPYLLEFRDHSVSSDDMSGAQSINVDECDIGDDFVAFEKRLRGEAGASSELLSAFNRVRSLLEAEAAK